MLVSAQFDALLDHIRASDMTYHVDWCSATLVRHFSFQLTLSRSITVLSFSMLGSTNIALLVAFCCSLPRFLSCNSSALKAVHIASITTATYFALSMTSATHIQTCREPLTGALDAFFIYTMWIERCRHVYSNRSTNHVEIDRRVCSIKLRTWPYDCETPNEIKINNYSITELPGK